MTGARTTHNRRAPIAVDIEQQVQARRPIVGQCRKQLIALCFAAILMATSRADENWQTEPIIPRSPCGDCFGPCVEPKMQFTLDGVLMGRTNVDGRDLIFNFNNGDVLLRTDDLLSEAEMGARIGLIIYGNEDRGLEFAYFGLDELGNSINVSADAPLIFPFFGGVPANPRNEYDVMYKSTLNSGELNLRHRSYSRVNLLAGLRILDLNERFTIRDNTGGWFSGTDNDLFGFQLGGDAYLLNVRRSIIFSTIKAGVYYNQADVKARAASVVGNPLRIRVREENSAFVGDLALGMLIPMGPAADLRIAYQGLYMDGVGLAPDQADNYSLFDGIGTFDTSTIFYHGGFIGFDLFW